MHSDSIPTRCEKLALVWSSRRERMLAVHVEYEIVESHGCRVYWLYRTEELG